MTCSPRLTAASIRATRPDASSIRSVISRTSSPIRPTAPPLPWPAPPSDGGGPPANDPLTPPPRPATLHRELSHLLGNHRKATASLTGARRLDRGIQRAQVRLPAGVDHHR